MNESVKTGQTQIKQHKRNTMKSTVTKKTSIHNDGNMTSASADSH